MMEKYPLNKDLISWEAVGSAVWALYKFPYMIYVRPPRFSTKLDQNLAMPSSLLAGSVSLTGCLFLLICDLISGFGHVSTTQTGNFESREPWSPVKLESSKGCCWTYDRNSWWISSFSWNDLRIMECTPWQVNMEPNNHPIEKENHLPNLHVWVPY